MVSILGKGSKTKFLIYIYFIDDLLTLFSCRLFGKTSGVSHLTSVSLPIQVTQKLSNRGIAQSSTVITNCAILFFAKNPVNFSIQQHSLIGSVLVYIKLREGFPKKSSFSFGFVQITSTPPLIWKTCTTFY